MKTAEKNGNEDVSLSEWKIGRIGLIFSLCVIALKLYALNREYLTDLFVQKQLIRYDVLTEEGQIMFRNAWTHTLKYSNIWFPLICGVLTTYFTWILVYLDSNVPGVQPPSPLSPQKYRKNSGHNFHLNYIFACLMGVLVSSYMYVKNIHLTY